MTGKQDHERCLFIGSKGLGLKVLRSLVSANDTVDWLVIHPDDQHDERNVQDEFRSYCEAENISIVVADSASHANNIMDTEEFSIAMVCGWYWLLPDHLLKSDGKNFYGIHNSLLPKYRGGAPLVWAIMNGEPVVGSSLFKLNEGMDAGNILDQARYELGNNDTIEDVLRYLDDYWGQNIGDVFKNIIHGKANEQRQDDRAATYCAQRTKQDGRINWDWRADYIHNFVRAQTKPYPCAFTMNGQDTIRVVKTSPVINHIFCTPGQIIRRAPDAVVIGCGDNTAISVVEAEILGKTTNLMSIFKSIEVRL